MHEVQTLVDQFELRGLRRRRGCQPRPLKRGGAAMKRALFQCFCSQLFDFTYLHQLNELVTFYQEYVI